MSESDQLQLEDGDQDADVNTVESSEAGNSLTGPTARAVLDHVLRSLASDPESVVIDADDTNPTLRFKVHVAHEDMGRIIGRRGRVAQAIRTLVRAAGSRDGIETSVDIRDD